MSSRSFAFIIEGDVFTSIEVDETFPIYDRMCETFTSNPIIIDVSDIPNEVGINWTWDGTTFTPPES